MERICFLKVGVRSKSATVPLFRTPDSKKEKTANRPPVTEEALELSRGQQIYRFWIMSNYTHVMKSSVLYNKYLPYSKQFTQNTNLIEYICQLNSNDH